MNKKDQEKLKLFDLKFSNQKPKITNKINNTSKK